MLEQTDGKQTPPPGGPAPTTPATAAPQAGATDEKAVKEYLALHPEVLGSLTATLKVHGKEVQVPYSELPSHAQKGLAATQTWEEAARMKADAERKEAELAAKGDPFNAFVERLRPTPPTPPSPLAAITDPNEILANPQLAVSVMTEQQRRLDDLEKRYGELGKTNETKLAEVARQSGEALRQYEQRMELARTFEETRRADPSFTASITGVNTDGTPIIDYGSNPYVTAIALSLKYSDQPSPILGGKVGKTMPLTEVTQLVRADMTKQVKEAETREQARIEAERRQAAGGLSGGTSGAVGMEVPPELRPVKGDTPEVALDKQLKLRALVLKRASDAGIAGD